MKLLISLLFVTGLFRTADLVEIRKIYPQAASSEDATKELAAKLEGVSDSGDKTLLAYKGAVLTLKAKFAKSIPDKIGFVKDGAKIVESAVAAEPSNVEIRMIRLSIQENVPAIVGYKRNIDEDKAFIVNNYKNLPGDLREYVKNFILQSKSFSKAQKLAAK